MKIISKIQRLLFGESTAVSLTGTQNYDGEYLMETHPSMWSRIKRWWK